MKRFIQKCLIMILSICSIVLMSPAMKAEAANSHVFVDDNNIPAQYQIESCYGTVKAGKSTKCSFKLDISGKMTIKVANVSGEAGSSIQSMHCWLYDSSDRLITSDSIADGNSVTYVYYLSAGNYSIKIAPDTYCDAKKYKINYKFLSSKESYTETATKNDNSFAKANKIDFYGNSKQEIKGQFGYKDSNDYYKFKMPVKGTITFTYKSKKECAAYTLYDSKKKKIDEGYLAPGSKSLKKTYSLKAGNYYLVCNYGSLTGENQDVDDWGFYTASLWLKTKQAATLDVNYKGKTVSVCKVQDLYDTCNEHYSTVNYATLKKNWGLAKISDSYSNKVHTYNNYRFKKGKSSVEIGETVENGKVTWDSISIAVEDKNMLVNGVKVGMKKNTAIKILQKKYGKNAIICDKNSIQIPFGPWMWLKYKVKSGKIAAFYFSHS